MTSGSAAALQMFCLLNVAQPPTVDETVNKLLCNEAPVRTQTVGTALGRRTDDSTVCDSIIESEPVSIESAQADRETTEPEHVAGELRRWRMLPADWDGEGAAAPNARSIAETVAFVTLLPATVDVPAPMLHSSGRAGLFWKTPQLYADLEFLGDGRVAYYVERNGDKHKGVLNFDKKTMPAVFETILASERISAAAARPGTALSRPI